MEKASSFSKYLCTVVILHCATGGYAQNADIDLLKKINIGRNKHLDAPMQAITNSVYPLSASVPLTELIAGYARHDRQLIATGWTTTAGLAGNFIITFGLKYSVDKTRPYITYPEIQNYKVNKDASFPSGHTSFAFNTATSLVMACPRWYVAVPAYTWAGVVGYSRMHLGMHYPTDVLMGAVIGAGTSLLAVKGNQWLTKHKHKKLG
jgi:membrane-associated phospholipid phosphatase